MKLLRRLLCWMGAHRLPDGVQHRTAIVWCCVSCGELVPGGMSERRRR